LGIGVHLQFTHLIFSNSLDSFILLLCLLSPMLSFSSSSASFISASSSSILSYLPFLMSTFAGLESDEWFVLLVVFIGDVVILLLVSFKLA
jgi:hypothetical protein